MKQIHSSREYLSRIKCSWIWIWRYNSNHKIWSLYFHDFIFEVRKQIANRYNKKMLALKLISLRELAGGKDG